MDRSLYCTREQLLIVEQRPGGALTWVLVFFAGLPTLLVGLLLQSPDLVGLSPRLGHRLALLLSLFPLGAGWLYGRYHIRSQWLFDLKNRRLKFSQIGLVDRLLRRGPQELEWSFEEIVRLVCRDVGSLRWVLQIHSAHHDVPLELVLDSSQDVQLASQLSGLLGCPIEPAHG